MKSFQLIALLSLSLFQGSRMMSLPSAVVFNAAEEQNENGFDNVKNYKKAKIENES